MEKKNNLKTVKRYIFLHKLFIFQKRCAHVISAVVKQHERAEESSIILSTSLIFTVAMNY